LHGLGNAESPASLASVDSRFPVDPRASRGALAELSRRYIDLNRWAKVLLTVSVSERPLRTIDGWSR